MDWRRILAFSGSALILALLIGVPLSLFGSSISKVRQEARERRAEEKAGSCWIISIQYDGITDRGEILYRCPLKSGGTNDMTLPGSWNDLKERVNSY